MTLNLLHLNWRRPDADEAVLKNVGNGRRWTIIALLTAAAIINYLDRATISVALPRIAQEFALGPTAKGLVLSAFFWCYTLLQIPVGIVVDRCSMRWFYAGAFALWSVSCGITGLVGGLASLIAIRVVLGAGEAVMLPGSLKLVNILFAPRDRGLPTGMVSSGTRLGLALGTPLVAWLTVRYGWRWMFAVVGFAALVWLLPWVLAYPRQTESSEMETSGLDPGAMVRTDPLTPAQLARGEKGSVDLPSPGALGSGGRFRRSRRLLTIDRNLVGSCLGYFSYGYYQYMLMTWLPDYFVHVRHIHLMRAGIYAAISYFIWGSGAAVGGWLSDVLVRRGFSEARVRKIVISAAYSTGLLLIPAVLVRNASLAMLLVAAASLVGLSSADILVIMQDCAPHGEVGGWIGAGNFVGNLGGVLSPLVTGVLISWTGSYFPGFALAPLVLVAGILPFWLVVKDLKSEHG